MKLSNKLQSLLLASFLLLPFTANAAMEKGDHEISFTGSFTSSDAADSLLLFGSYGLMIKDNLQVFGTATLIEIDFGFGSSTFGLLGGGANFYLPAMGKSEDMIPYVGGSATFTIGDGPSITFLEGHAGIKNFISESTALFGEARFMTDTSDLLGTNQFMLMAGISINFNAQ